jgi:drug/metabolite transporter (DMT)-like permease
MSSAARPPQASSRGVVPAVLVVVLLWAGSYIAVKRAQAVIPPLPLATFRCLGAAVVLGTALFVVRRRIPRLSSPEWATIVLLGLTGGTAFQLCLVGGLAFTTPAHSALLTCLSPVFTVLLAVAWLGEPLGARRAAGILVAFGGVTLIIARDASLTGGGSVVGDLLSLGAGLAWAVYSVAGKPLLARHRAVDVTALSTIVGAIPLLALGMPGLAAVDWGALGPRMWLLLVYLSAITLGVGSLLWFWALARAATARVVVFTYLTPVVAAALSVSLGDEALTATLVAGAVTVVGGVALAQLG